MTTKLSAVVTKNHPMGSMKVLDVVIIGGGLSGVLVSHGLQQQQQQQQSPVDWRLLEARNVLGGRLVNDSAGQEIDLGGAWVWPAHQPRMRRLLQQLAIPTFAQPGDPSSTRFDGGAVKIVDYLAQDLPNQRIQLDTAVKACLLQQSSDLNDIDNNEPLVQIQTMTDETLYARRVVFAVPPKLLHKHVTFDPPLSAAKQQALEEAHTWMAGVTKIALVYPHRFWSLQACNMGLPSYLGPAFQVYDSSTKNESVSALTFFALANQDKNDATLAKQVADQMQKAWAYLGEKEAAQQAHSYTQHFVQRWPKQTYISEDAQPKTIHPHPHPVRALSTPEWNGLLLFAGSEMDQSSPGVMEGAVGAAQCVLQSLQNVVWTKSSATTAANRVEQESCSDQVASGQS